MNKILHYIPAPIVSGLNKILHYIPAPSALNEIISLKVLQYTGDMVGYETLIQFIEREGLMNLPGDLIEIGSFVGGGTAKLAHFAKRFGKRVYAIDIFDISADNQRNIHGATMSQLYSSYLQRIRMSQWQAYQHMIHGLPNVITIRSDSMKVSFPVDKEFCFGFIDGNHTPEYVMNDFYLLWRHLVSGGALGFHDYGGDLPKITSTIDFLISKHKNDNDIKKTVRIPDRWIIILVKK